MTEVLYGYYSSGKRRKKASIELSALNAEQNKALSFIAESIVLNKNEIFENEIDLKEAKMKICPNLF